MIRPGITVQFSSTAAVPRGLASPSTYFVAGYAEWGPVDQALYIGSKSDVLQALGNPVNYGWLVRNLNQFLESSSGTGRAYAVRGFEVLSSKTLADYTATVTLVSSTAVVLATLSAAWAGAKGNELKYDVFQDTLGRVQVCVWDRFGAPNIFEWKSDAVAMRLKALEIGQNADAIGSDVRLAIPETFLAGPPKLTTPKQILLRPTKPETVGATVYTGAVSFTGGSNGETTTFPISRLTGGLDTATSFPFGLEVVADERFGPGVVAIPGYAPTGSTTEKMELHCALYERLALVHLLPSGPGVINPSQAVSLKDTLTASTRIAYYYPQVIDSDNITTPVEGFVAGLASRKQASIDSEGGVKASLTGILPIVGVRPVGGRDPVTNAAADLLFSNSINYVKFYRGQGYRLDSQVLSGREGAITRIHHRTIIMKFTYDLREILQQFRDRTIDGGQALQREIRDTLYEYFDPWGPGKTAPRGNTLYAPVIVVADNSVQNSLDLNEGTLTVIVSGKFSPKAERINLLFNVLPISV